MEPWAIAILIKPFALLGFLTFFLLVRYLVIWFCPEGRVKRFLLFRVDERGGPAEREIGSPDFKQLR